MKIWRADSVPTPAKKQAQDTAAKKNKTKDVKAGLALATEEKDDEESDEHKVYMPAHMACVYIDSVHNDTRSLLTSLPDFTHEAAQATSSASNT